MMIENVPLEVEWTSRSRK